MRSVKRWRPGWGSVVGTLALLPLMLGQGCPGVGGAGTAGITVQVSSPSIDQTVRIGDTVTIVYNATSQDGSALNVSAFYDIDGVAGTGDEVVFATGLENGTGKFVQMATSALSPGVVRVGIIVSGTAGSGAAYAPGVLTLSQGASIRFLSPATPISVAPGSVVNVKFDAGLTNFTYRLFYDTDGVADGDETTIASGTSATSVVEKDFNTSGLSARVYYLGVTVTASSGVAVTSYTNATISVVTGALIQVLSPTAGLIAAPGEPVVVRVAVSGSIIGASIRIFYDLNNVFGDGNDTTITTITPSAGSAIWDTTGVPEGIYHVGAELQNGLVPPLFDYSDGPVEISSTAGGSGAVGTFTIVAPLGDVTVVQGNPFEIRWVTGAAATDGTVSLSYDRDVNNDNIADGSPVSIVTGLDPAQRSYEWTPANLLGYAFVVGQLTLNDGTVIERTSLGRVFIREQATWVGNVGTGSAASVPGVIFRGFNFNDFAGSSFAPVADIDGDSIDDMVIVSQFGKPGLFNPDGTGRGEAYLIYGGQLDPDTAVDLNTTGEFDEFGELRSLNGVIFPGIATAPIPPALSVSGSDIAGLPAVYAIRDQDDDLRPELVFGFPRANSVRISRGSTRQEMWAGGRVVTRGSLSKEGQFLAGGFILVSSRNTRIANRESRDTSGSRVLDTQLAGQTFDSYLRTLFDAPTNLWRCVPPLDANGAPECAKCDPAANPLSYERGTGQYPTCGDAAGGGDNCNERISDHRVSFPESLVESRSSKLSGFSAWANNGCSYPDTTVDPAFYNWGVLTAGVPWAWFQIENMCGDLSGLPEVNSTGTPTGRVYLGSGFYLGESTEPYGFRVRGYSGDAVSGDLLGQSLSVVDDFLVVGAPGRTADTVDYFDLLAPRVGSGVVYQFKLRSPISFPRRVYGYSTTEATVSVNPRPHQYAVDQAHCDGTGYVDFSGFHVVGAEDGDQIGFAVAGIADFNGDLKGDILIGSPGAFSVANGGNDSGAVYLLYRRTTSLVEGDYDLAKIHLPTTDRSRLNGVLIRGRAGETFGRALGPGWDLNGDSVPEVLDINRDTLPDAILGNQNYNNKRGEVVILFGNHELISPANGFTIDDLVNTSRAAVIRGENVGDLAGYNVAYAGDFDGDGFADWMVSAPEASPQVDTNGDGIKETLTKAGIVYLIFSSNDIQGGDVLSLGDIRTGALKGLIFNGRAAGDRLGGGEVPSFTASPANGFGTNGMRARSISWAGDVNDDGLSDVLLGSPMASPFGKTRAGEVYLLYGFTSR